MKKVNIKFSGQLTGNFSGEVEINMSKIGIKYFLGPGNPQTHFDEYERALDIIEKKIYLAIKKEFKKIKTFKVDFDDDYDFNFPIDCCEFTNKKDRKNKKKIIQHMFKDHKKILLENKKRFEYHFGF